MSVEFSNAYQEILLDNLVAIIKQNFIFQTQLKLAEDSGKATAEIQARYDELIRAHETLKDFKAKADVNAKAVNILFISFISKIVYNIVIRVY